MKIDYLLILIAGLALSVSARGLSAAQNSHDSGGRMMQTQNTVSALHDFDFLVGHWQVHHRRLKERLADNQEWIDFEGSSIVRKVMGGYGLSDDNVLEFP